MIKFLLVLEILAMASALIVGISCVFTEASRFTQIAWPFIAFAWVGIAIYQTLRIKKLEDG